MNADDLAPLFQAGDTTSAVGFHIGRVLAWNTATGQNTVEVLGTPLTDLPTLNIGDTTNLSTGDVVAVLKAKTSWFILGRIALPGSQVFATTAVEFYAIPADQAQNLSLQITGTDTTVTSWPIPVPAWANRVALHITHALVARNTHATTTGWIYTSIWLPSPLLDSAQNYQAVPAGGVGTVIASHSVVGDCTPGGSILVEGRAQAQVGGTFTPASAWNQGHLSGFAMFTRV